MKKLLAASAIALVLPHTALATPQEDYEALREEVWQDMLDNSWWLALAVGDPRGDGTLGDSSLAGFDQRAATAGAFLARLDAIDATALPEEMQVDYAILHRSLADDVDAAGYAHERFVVFTNRGGPHTTLASLPYSSPLFTAHDYESYISRIEAFPALVEQVIERTDGAIARGLTQPCISMQGYAASITAMISATPEESMLWDAFATRPQTIGEGDWSALQDRARAAITDGGNAGLSRFADYYVQNYQPACRTGLPGVGQTEGGADYYEYLVRHYTTTAMTSAEVHALGLSEVARIRAEMEDVAAEAGFASREAYIEHLRTDPRYYPESPEELLQVAGAIAKQIDGWMPRLFGNLPRLPYTVLPIPAATAPGNTTAYYEPGSLATGQPGIYRVNTTELDQRPLFEMPALGVHEAVPGHHHQISLQQELDLHPIRTNGAFFTAFVEGWGLYSERLGIEMGLYDTPARNMGRLSYEMWRATRLVVDTGIHAQGWSKQQAIDFMAANTALSTANIEAEVNRYITNPGQALAYKLGELKIRELRARAEGALGGDFDLRAFHDRVLENGAVPLDVLDAHVNRWIEGQLAARES